MVVVVCVCVCACVRACVSACVRRAYERVCVCPGVYCLDGLTYNERDEKTNVCMCDIDE